jgi:ubiquinone/menaquinone biosynthesis C-methylase UbiE
MEELAARFYIFPKVELILEDFESSGYILDVGGGGEGVIGQLKGRDVVAIDLQEEELEEAADGFLKIVMDARELQFLDGAFGTATAFFSMMYLDSVEDQRQVFKEVWRVLAPGGTFHLWDVDLPARPKTDKEAYLVHLSYQIGEDVVETGYGRRWPTERRGIEHYLKLAEGVGFRLAQPERNKHTFYMQLIKG